MNSVVAAVIMALFSLGCTHHVIKEDSLVGTWSGWNLSQLGPVYQRYTFRDDGTFGCNARILAVPFIAPNTTGGVYYVEAEYLVTASEVRTNRYRFAMDGNDLRIQEPNYKEVVLKRR